MDDRMRLSRCSKIMSMLQSVDSSSSQESNCIENLLPSSSNENNNLNVEDIGDLDFDSDDSVFDKDYVVPSSLDTKVYSEDSDSSGDEIPNSQPTNLVIPESPETISVDIINNEPQNLTKKGKPRKRKRFEMSAAQRKQIKKLSDMETKYTLKPGCSGEFKRNCHNNFSEQERRNINLHFRNMCWQEQQSFMKNNTSKEEPKRTTVKENRKLPRNVTVSYFLSNENGRKFNVCKVFFLETLGFNRKNDKSVRTASNSMPNIIPQDRRGNNPNPKKISEERIIEHINSFKPSISHYRREHAPNRKYLPSDLTITTMYENFCDQENISDLPEGEKISYDYYRKIVKKLNISFTKLGHEECDICEVNFIHNPEYKLITHRNCKDCREYERHRENYTSARKAYENDADIQNNTASDTGFYSADLEKVIMLPRLEEFKRVLFCPRVIVFNETFVPIGKKKNNPALQTFAAVWHEAVAGRKVSD